MVKVFLKDGRVIEVVKATGAEFVTKDELQIKPGSWSTEMLASFPRSEVAGFTIEEDPKVESK
jgi:hypothetical protein